MLVKSTGRPIMPTIFDDFFRDWSPTNFSKMNPTLPAVNIREDENEFTLEVAIPGMDKKDFQINVENDVLTLASEKDDENEVQKESYTRREYNYRAFKRSFNLPEDQVDTDKITADYKNGELIISLPKREEIKPKPARLIEIK